MQNIVHTLLAVMLASLAAKLVLEGVDTLPKYCRRRGATALGKPAKCILLAPCLYTIGCLGWMCRSVRPHKANSAASLP